METDQPTSDLFHAIVDKANLKQNVYDNTYKTFVIFKSVIKQLAKEFQDSKHYKSSNVTFEYKNRGEFEVELKFAGDILIFIMHTNIFEFPRNHEVMRLPYIKEDPERSYCGIINIYNFLGDSFKYKRINDLGYLIGRVFINKDTHYFIEGKRELGRLYRSFDKALMTEESANKLITSAMSYTINFDLLTPPYEEVKLLTVQQIQTSLDDMKIRTGKRLGFKFQADEEEEEKAGGSSEAPAL